MITPWGDADQLRSKMLRPGPGVAREVVVRSQRERLFAATVAVVAERGYEAMTVADILRVSGVSRSTFYEQFQNKEDCFLATFDELLGAATATMERRIDEPGELDPLLYEALEAGIGIIVAQPAAARLCFVEIYAAGAAGTARVEAVTTAFERIVRRALRHSPEHAGMPRELIRAIIGGIRKVIVTRLRLGKEKELPDLVPDLWRWAMSYRTPPQRLRRPRRRAEAPAGSPFVSYDPADRILSAVAATVREKGYPNMTVADIVRAASISLSTFYAHFRSKEEAMLATFDRIQAHAIAATLPAYNRAPDWPHAVRAGLHALVAYSAVHSDAAYLGDAQMFAAGLRALAARDNAVAAFEAALAPGYQEHSDTPGIAAEAVGGAIYALLYDHILRREPETLTELGPTATFIALTPFIGAEASCEIANERGAARRRKTGATNAR